MKILFLAPSRLSRGDAGIAAELARQLPRSRFQVGFVAASEAVPQLHDVGMPTLPLNAADPAGNLAVLDRVVRGFRPDCLVVADAFALHQARAWSGLTLGLLRERYGLPIGSFDRLGWQAAGYRVDAYGGGSVQLPPLLDGCDLLIRTSPPHPPDGPVPPGVAVAALPPGGLREGGLRSAVAGASDGDAGDAGNPGGAAGDPGGAGGPGGGGAGKPVVLLVNSPWEYRVPAGSLPVAQLVDALPRILHSHLAALRRPLRVIHVGPRRWRFPVAEQVEYQHFNRLPYPMFHSRLATADLFLTTNVLSATLGRAVLAGVPALVLQNQRPLEGEALPDWLAGTAPLLRAAYPFRVAPLGWHDLLEPLLTGNPYQECFATAGLFDRPQVLRHLAELLDDGTVRGRLRQRQHDYRDRLAAMAPPVEAFQEMVSR